MMTPNSPFQFEQSDAVLIVTPQGRQTQYRDEELRHAYNETYRRLSDEGVTHLLFDFSKMDYFGSTFVGIMIRLARKARQCGGEAVLCSLSGNMQEMMKSLMLLENTKTDFYWASYPDRAAALTALSAPE